MSKNGNKPKPIVSIVIPVLNQSAMTVRCLQSIRANTKLPYEIIWVDNGSTPEHYGTIRRQATRPRVQCKLVQNKMNLGFIKATNQGIREAVGEYVILLNNDTEVHWKWASQLTKPLTYDKTVGAVGPITQSKIAWQEAQNVNARFFTNIPKLNGFDKEAYSKLVQKSFGGKYVDVGKLPLSFFCVALRRSIFKEVGMLCEEMSIGLGDDDEFCMRLRAHGYKLMLSLGTFVYHAHRTTFNALSLGLDSLRRYNLRILKKKEKELKKKNPSSLASS